jgi:aldose 1-epimerase
LPPNDVVTQRSDDATLEISPSQGGRLRSLQVRGIELLRTFAADELDWGCYPMAPWTGRVRRGRFSFGDRDFSLPLRNGSHAMHGTVLDRAWRVDDEFTFTTELGDAWPFGGFARHRIQLSTGCLDMRLEVHASDLAMPASCGWHPWFLRRLAIGEPAQLKFDAGYMLLRDDENIPSTTRVAPPQGPWDDCFGDVRWPANIRWPGALQLRIESSCHYAVVFDERAEGLCVEPCTAPPDALNGLATTVAPGRPLVAESRWSWAHAAR